MRRLRAAAAAAPLRPREPLAPAGGLPAFGSLEPALGERMVAAGLPLRRGDGVWLVDGEPSAALQRLAHWLAGQGLASRWRDELLDVVDTGGRVVAAIERAAVRPLGIATQAVHLVGRAPSGAHWVQQRALDKSTDPGLWDTLMGGLIASGESVRQALERETWEEAGLQLGALQRLAPQGRVVVQRPVREGYMVEHIHVFSAVLPEGIEPENQDGEVLRFECIAETLLDERLVAGTFTLEAALVIDAARR